MKCPVCATDNNEGTKICTTCGNPLESRSQVFFRETKWIMLIFLILILVSIPCCAFLGYRTNWILWTLGLR